MREEKLIESSPKLCSQGLSRGAPRKRVLGRLVGALTFCLFTCQLNPGSTQALPSRWLQEWLSFSASSFIY